MTINTLIAELRAGLGRNQNVWHLERDELHALLDHIESCGNELDALMAERAEFKRRAEAAEAELARLRKPVGEVKGVVRSLSLIACAPRCEHASECNCTVLDNAADLIQRLAGQVAEVRGEADMANGAIHAVRETLAAGNVPTAAFVDDHVRNAIVQRDAAEARLREAVEVMRQVSMACDTYGEDLSFGDMKTVHRTQKLVSAFLSTLEDHSNG